MDPAAQIDRGSRRVARSRSLALLRKLNGSKSGVTRTPLSLSGILQFAHLGRAKEWAEGGGMSATSLLEVDGALDRGLNSDAHRVKFVTNPITLVGVGEKVQTSKTTLKYIELLLCVGQSLDPWPWNEGGVMPSRLTTTSIFHPV